MDLKQLIDLLSNGGWGVACIAVWALFKLHKQMMTMQEERHKEFVACLKEATTVMASVVEAIRKCERPSDDD